MTSFGRSSRNTPNTRVLLRWVIRRQENKRPSLTVDGLLTTFVLTADVPIQRSDSRNDERALLCTLIVIRDNDEIADGWSVLLVPYPHPAPLISAPMVSRPIHLLRNRHQTLITPRLYNPTTCRLSTYETIRCDSLLSIQDHQQCL